MTCSVPTPATTGSQTVAIFHESSDVAGRGVTEGSAMSAELAAPLDASDDLTAPARARLAMRTLVSRTLALCLVELQKLRRDKTEIFTRAVQPALWLIVFGNTFTRIRAIPTGDVPYLD